MYMPGGSIMVLEKDILNWYLYIMTERVGLGMLFYNLVQCYDYDIWFVCV